jgi:hypothetical protein
MRLARLLLPALTLRSIAGAAAHANAAEFYTEDLRIPTAAAAGPQGLEAFQTVATSGHPDLDPERELSVRARRDMHHAGLVAELAIEV